jgi:hypothetical protein
MPQHWKPALLNSQRREQELKWLVSALIQLVLLAGYHF